MPPSEELTALYEHTQYRVRLACGGHAVIRIGQPLPEALRQTLPHVETPWAFVTAWNPRSEEQSIAVNRARQRKLLQALRKYSPVLIAGVGVGEKSRWREPSLFVAGIPLQTLDDVMQPFRQHAIVRGTGTETTQLHWLD